MRHLHLVGNVVAFCVLSGEVAGNDCIAEFVDDNIRFSFI